VKTNPNLPDAQMSVNSILTKDYERNDIFAVPENKANSNPIKPNLPDAQRHALSYAEGGKTKVRCRFSEVRYLSSAFCFLASVHGPNDRNRLQLQWHVRVQKTSQTQDFVFQIWCQLYRFP